MLATKTHTRVPRVMAKLEQVMEAVLGELHDAGRVFGTIKASANRADKRPVLKVA